MVTTERPTVVIDLTTKLTVEAALFCAMSAGFLLWGLIARSASANILTFAIMATVAILVDRIIPFLPGPPTLGQAHDAAPKGAVCRTWERYAAEGAGIMVALGVLYVALVVYLAQPGFVAGWMTAYCVSRLRALATVREIERASGVRLSVRVQRTFWGKRTPTYYATPRLV